MTVRTAELLMALMMGVFSIYLMYKSTELPIGWIEDEGPGGGTWPFWLAAIMLLSCIGILVNWFLKKVYGETRVYHFEITRNPVADPATPPRRPG